MPGSATAVQPQAAARVLLAVAAVLPAEAEAVEAVAAETPKALSPERRRLMTFVAYLMGAMAVVGFFAFLFGVSVIGLFLFDYENLSLGRVALGILSLPILAFCYRASCRLIELSKSFDEDPPGVLPYHLQMSRLGLALRYFNHVLSVLFLGWLGLVVWELVGISSGLADPSENYGLLSFATQKSYFVLWMLLIQVSLFEAWRSTRLSSAELVTVSSKEDGAIADLAFKRIRKTVILAVMVGALSVPLLVLGYPG